MKFIHCADIHLGSPLRGLERYEGAPVERIRSAPEAAFEALVDFAISEPVDFVVIAGDLYDGSWRDYRVGLRVVGLMRRLKEAGIGVYLLYGNHDAESRLTRSVPLPDNVYVFGSKRAQTFTDGRLGIAVHGQSFKTPAVAENLVAAYPRRVDHLLNIGVLHTGLQGGYEHALYAPCHLQELQGFSYDYWALGHVHGRVMLSQEPYVLFPGNLQGRQARENGAKGFTLVTVDESKMSIVSAVHMPCDIVRWEILDVPVGGASDIDEVASAFADKLSRAVNEAESRLVCCRAVLSGRTAVHGKMINDPEHLTAALRAAAIDIAGDAAWLERVDVQTHPEQDIAALASRPDALGTLLHALEQPTSGVGELLEKELRRVLDLLPEGGTVNNPLLTSLREHSLDLVLKEARRTITAGLLEMEDLQ